MKFRSLQLAALLVLALSPALSVAAIDLDGDGVPDDRDECPQTPEKTPVDTHGCPLKIEPEAKSEPQPQPQPQPDLEAQPKSEPPPAPSPAAASEPPRCATPPPGAIIDSFGCAVDEDGDGVPDGLDRCPHTVSGAVVDAAGCLLHLGKKGPAAEKTDKTPPVSARPETALSKLVQENTPEKPRKSGKPAPAPAAPSAVAEPVPAAAAGELSSALTVSFAAGSAELSSDALRKLDLLARRFVEASASKPTLKLELQAHANAADGATSRTLAQDRLDIVRVYLLAQGVGRDRFALLANQLGRAGAVEIRLIE